MFWRRETTCKPCGGFTTTTAECQTHCSPSNFPVLASTPARQRKNCYVLVTVTDSAQVFIGLLTFAVSWHGPAAKSFAMRKYNSASRTNAVTHSAYHPRILTKSTQVHENILTWSHWRVVIKYTCIHNYLFTNLFTNKLMKIYYFSLNMLNKSIPDTILSTHFTSSTASLPVGWRGM